MSLKFMAQAYSVSFSRLPIRQVQQTTGTQSLLTIQLGLWTSVFPVSTAVWQSLKKTSTHLATLTPAYLLKQNSDQNCFYVGHKIAKEKNSRSKTIPCSAFPVSL